MGSSQSSPEDDIIKEINLEIDYILNNLEKCKPSTATTIFTENQKHIEELKTKLTALYKCIKTYNEFIEALSSENVDIKSPIEAYRNTFYEVEKEKEKESKAKKLIQEEWIACKLKCTEHEEALLKLKQDLYKKKKTMKNLQDDKENLQARFSMENKARQVVADKLRAAEECLEDLNKDFATKQGQKWRVILDCQDEIATKTKQLDELKDKLEKINEQHKIEIARILDKSLTECQRKLDIKKTAKKVELDKLKAQQEEEVIKYKLEINSLKNQLTEIKSTPVQSSQKQPEKFKNDSNTRCCDDLKQKLNDKHAALENERKKYDKEINRLINQTNRIKNDLRRSQNKFKNEENLRREAEKNVSLLEKQILQFNDLQIKLKACQDELETEKRTKQEEINKYEIISLCSASLEKGLKTNKIEREAEASNYQAQISTIRNDLFKSRKDCERQSALRESVEKQVILLKEQITDIRMLEEKLKTCHENLEMEKKARQQESSTLQLLKEESELKKAEVKKYKQNISKLSSELNKAKNDLNKIKNDCKQQELLRKTAESKMLVLEKQTATLNILQGTLKEYQESLDKETKAKQDETEKLKVITQYSNNLKEEIGMQQVKHEKMIFVYKTEIEVQTTQLDEIKTALNSEAGKTGTSDLSVVDEKNSNEDYTSLEQLRKNNKLIEVIKQHLEETLLEISKYKDEVKLNKFFIDYQEKNDYESILRKQEKSLYQLKEKLRTTRKKKNQSDGKILLMEESFQSLKQFCDNELQGLKSSLKQIKENGPSENLVEPFIHNTKKNLTVTGTSQTKEAAPTVVVTNRDYAINEKFCANQRKELSELHRQFESFLNKT